MGRRNPLLHTFGRLVWGCDCCALKASPARCGSAEGCASMNHVVELQGVCVCARVRAWTLMGSAAAVCVPLGLRIGAQGWRSMLRQTSMKR